MHLELIAALRCIGDHEESTLVASIDRLEGRYVASGSLGCPICHRRYLIRDFVADFRDNADRRWCADDAPEAELVDDDRVVRAAAMLDLRTPGALYLLAGAWGALATRLVIGYDVQCAVINPLTRVAAADGVSILRVSGRIPLAARIARGLAIDEEMAKNQTLLSGCLNSVQPGGRVVAPAGAELLSGVRELARDSSWWVGERLPPALTLVGIGNRKSGIGNRE